MLGLVRFDHWFTQKLSPLLVLAYALLWAMDAAPSQAWRVLPFVLLSICCVAAYGHVVNDWFDIESDEQAGKSNSLAGVAPAMRFALAALLFAAGFGILALGPSFGRLWPLLAANYLLPTIYSIPPIRLKERSLAGVVSDALAAHLIPALLVSLALRNIAGPLGDSAWMGLTLSTCVVELPGPEGDPGAPGHGSPGGHRCRRADVCNRAPPGIDPPHHCATGFARRSSGFGRVYLVSADLSAAGCVGAGHLRGRGGIPPRSGIAYAPDLSGNAGPRALPSADQQRVVRSLVAVRPHLAPRLWRPRILLVAARPCTAVSRAHTPDRGDACKARGRRGQADSLAARGPTEPLRLGLPATLGQQLFQQRCVLPLDVQQIVLTQDEVTAGLTHRSAT